MTWSERIRRLIGLVPLPALLLAAACGGDDNKSPTGPGNQGQGLAFPRRLLGIHGPRTLAHPG